MNSNKSKSTDLDKIAIVGGVALIGLALWSFISTGTFSAILKLLFSSSN